MLREHSSHFGANQGPLMNELPELPLVDLRRLAALLQPDLPICLDSANKIHELLVSV